LVAFNGLAGVNPISGLLQSPDGYFYGTTVSGGTNNQGTVYRLNFHLSVAQAPQIFIEPQGQSVQTGATVSFNVVASGAMSLSYQWQSNSVNLVDNARIHGSQSSTVSIAGVLPSDAGLYRVIVNNSYGFATSTNALLQITSQSIPTLQAATFNRSINTFSLSWQTTTGQGYQLQSVTNMTSSNWINLGSVLTGNNTTISITNTIGTDLQRFYRVLLVQ
jgi:uncharacterized repeat protein (TIGR03803 family)